MAKSRIPIKTSVFTVLRISSIATTDKVFGKFLLLFCDSNNSEGLLVVISLSNKYKWNFLILDMFRLTDDALWLFLVKEAI